MHPNNSQMQVQKVPLMVSLETGNVWLSTVWCLRLDCSNYDRRRSIVQFDATRQWIDCI